ncbi:cytochrome-c peroxidase [Paracoccus aminophilus]|uniref:Methylamine utilization protein mauG n=1 Tax=Paracoccus aminophilus JCM 7686 TaxID=1367847 RepID=S5XV95_PARAH|nr:cytochrome c peroxidase [Paracoccus aminophilus]AGT07280.1 methylamine utilization protein mauG [Paracoccus aminophilus JCM 7686]
MLTRRTLACVAAAGVLAASVVAGLASSEKSEAPAAADQQAMLAALGSQLFFDPALSKNGTQSCSTCHDPDHAFVDPRESVAGTSVSLGDDGESLGDRNTPTLGYVSRAPSFHLADSGEYKGGQFWDGRADDLTAQAGQPMLNPVEMGMPDKAAVVERLRQNVAYVESFDRIYGPNALGDVEQAFNHAAAALAAYQSTPEFSPFDSRFDRYLRGEEKLTKQEEFGYTVYLTWNCRLCHQIRTQGVETHETFTNSEYRNIGIPVNHEVRALNGKGDGFVDPGLAGHPGLDDPSQKGKFKVPTLRNVAVSGPYMHNGVFKDLRTAVVFYNKYTTNNPKWQINPETGEAWGDPEVPENLAMKELRSGLTVSDERVDALVAFLETLTDKRYEPLLAEQKAEREAARLRVEAAN